MVLKYSDLERYLISLGWEIDRHTSAHVIFTKEGKSDIITLSCHGAGKDISPGLVKDAFDIAGVTVKDYRNSKNKKAKKRIKDK
ncbi:type II toxin-antitoxin system HicA family toxin [Flectobacillus roseus]